jgi:hypothetical protein
MTQPIVGHAPPAIGARQIANSFFSPSPSEKKKVLKWGGRCGSYAAAPSFMSLPQPIQDREPLVRALEILGEQMKIFHRRGDLAMPEDDREAHHVPSVPQVLSRERVAQPMEPRLR